jgi:hypothetical protein
MYVLYKGKLGYFEVNLWSYIFSILKLTLKPHILNTILNISTVSITSILIPAKLKLLTCSSLTGVAIISSGVWTVIISLQLSPVWFDAHIFLE